MTGTVDSSTTDRIRPAPPRGISTSTSPRARISSLDALVGVAGDQLDDVGGQTLAATARAQRGDDRRVAGAGARAAPQQHRVARLQADAGGVGGDVGPGLVDHADHAERAPGPGAARARWPASRRAPPRRPGRAARPRRAGPAPSPRGGSWSRRSRSMMLGGVPAASARATSAALAARTVGSRGQQRVGHRVQRLVLAGPSGQGQTVAGLARPGGRHEHGVVGGHAVQRSADDEATNPAPTASHR